MPWFIKSFLSVINSTATKVELPAHKGFTSVCELTARIKHGGNMITPSFLTDMARALWLRQLFTT